jgi:hypothetical protein
MRRRNFIQTTLAAGGALCIPGIIRGLQPDELILGHNQKRYRIDTRWSKANPQTHPVKDCHEMVQDRKGRLFLLTNETRNNVLIYDKSGRLLDSWGKEYPGAHGLTIFDENGTEVLFICDNNRHQVIKTDLKGKVLMVLDYPKETGAYSKAEEYVPTETIIAPNGDIYVVDGYGKDFVIQYNHKGEYIRHFAGKGDGEQFVANAHGIAIDNRDPKNPCLVVTSRVQNAFKRYTLDGQYLSTVPLPGAWVCRPVIRGDYLYVAVLQSHARLDEKSGFVLILDKDYKVVSNLGGNLPAYQGNKPEEMYQTIHAFDYPHDVCVDDEENLYVAQWNSGQVYPYKLMPV